MHYWPEVDNTVMFISVEYAYFLSFSKTAVWCTLSDVSVILLLAQLNHLCMLILIYVYLLQRLQVHVF